MSGSVSDISWASWALGARPCFKRSRSFMCTLHILSASLFEKMFGNGAVGCRPCLHICSCLVRIRTLERSITKGAATISFSTLSIMMVVVGGMVLGVNGIFRDGFVFVPFLNEHACHYFGFLGCSFMLFGSEASQ